MLDRNRKRMRRVLLFVLAHTPVLSSGLLVNVSVHAKPVFNVKKEFLSVTMDAGQFFPGHFWRENETFPFHSNTVSSLARALSPAYFRVGGTEQDRLWYDLRGCFNVDRCKNEAKRFKEAVPKAKLDDMFGFARRVGFKVVFGLNAIGPRNGSSARKWGQGAWNPDNAAELISYAAKEFPDVSGWWELGNEPEAFAVFQHALVGMKQLVEDFRTLRETVRRISPAGKVVGCDSYGNPPFSGPADSCKVKSFLGDGGGKVVDAVTYHWYPLLGDCASALPPWLCRLVPGFATVNKAVTVAFNHTERKFAHMQKLVEASGKPLWLGEGALAAGGGRDGVSNRFASTLFYLFELGQAAITGHEVVFRQALTGARYSLIDVKSETPLPDYWAALLHKRLMGTQVHRVDILRPLRAFAHCHPSDEEVLTVLVVNPTNEGYDVHLDQATGNITTYLLTSADSSRPLSASRLRINGFSPEVHHGHIGAIPSVTISNGQVFAMPPYSAAFFSFQFPECQLQWYMSHTPIYGTLPLDRLFV